MFHRVMLRSIRHDVDRARLTDGKVAQVQWLASLAKFCSAKHRLELQARFSV